MAENEVMDEKPKPALFLGKQTDRAAIDKASQAMVEAMYEQLGTPLTAEVKAEIARLDAERRSNGS